MCARETDRLIALLASIRYFDKATTQPHYLPVPPTFDYYCTVYLLDIYDPSITNTSRLSLNFNDSSKIHRRNGMRTSSASVPRALDKWTIGQTAPNRPLRFDRRKRLSPTQQLSHDNIDFQFMSLRRVKIFVRTSCTQTPVVTCSRSPQNFHNPIIEWWTLNYVLGIRHGINLSEVCTFVARLWRGKFVKCGPRGGRNQF